MARPIQLLLVRSQTEVDIILLSGWEGLGFRPGDGFQGGLVHVHEAYEPYHRGYKYPCARNDKVKVIAKGSKVEPPKSREFPRMIGEVMN